ncbi:AAA family ATPase [Clostridium sp. BJN0001]|uniref:AAA family ATPase n=1 Tax=Clostridium sp. BJN0001 TaxID=2930219 RepID=UPI001FD4F406|nr:AAA family ATPase [Clostridium sp. BJN0001]
MIIKKAHIISFAGIKNKEINFEKGFNLIYGQNEKGKSTIENFIKVWLYGMDNARGKNNGRKKFMPISGNVMSGELIVENNSKSYIITRMFGNTKKDDSIEILDYITGQKVPIGKEEPGEYFLNINIQTFIKTLFIGQMSVSISKDKHEEIMEKITNLFSTGDEKVSIEKTVDRLVSIKKQLKGTRKNGVIDKLYLKKDKLSLELQELKRISESNMENEENLLIEKQKKKDIEKTLNSLQVYKKYQKKIKLKKEYKKISEYLIKKEDLKKQQEKIESELKKDKEPITEDYLKNFKENVNEYLNLQEKYKKLDLEIKDLKDKFNNEDNDELRLLDAIGENPKDKIYKLKYDRGILEDKIKKIIKLNRSNEEIEENLKKMSVNFDEKYIEENRKNIEELLSLYRANLENYKKILEKKKRFGFFRMKKVIASITTILSGILSFYFASKDKYIICIFVLFIQLLLYAIIYLNGHNSLKDAIKNINACEEKLKKYMSYTSQNTYENFIKMIKEYDRFFKYKENEQIILNRNNEELNSYNITDIKSKYNKNKGVISSILKIFLCDDLESVLLRIDEYEKKNLNNGIELTRLDFLKKEMISVNENIEKISKVIEEKCRFVGISPIVYDSLLDIIEEYEDKISKMNMIKSSLENVEEVYNTLLDNRNIKEIEQEVKEYINSDERYSYDTEEEIDQEISHKSDQMMEVLKNIKDLEYKILKLNIGKRDISSVLEDIEDTNQKIENYEKKFKATDIALLTLNDVFSELKKTVEPALNKSVLDRMNFITDDVYDEVKVSDEYSFKMKKEDVPYLFDGQILSKGAKDQIYLSLRLSIISMMFKDKNIVLFLDDAFVQYDDTRRKNALRLLFNEDISQILFFTCQKIDSDFINELKEDYISINL